MAKKDNVNCMFCGNKKCHGENSFMWTVEGRCHDFVMKTGTKVKSNVNMDRVESKKKKDYWDDPMWDPGW